MIANKLSKTAKTLIQTRLGFRNDLLGTGMYPICDIIKFETEEYCNDDIFITCEKFYGTKNYNEILKRAFPNEKIEELWGMWFATKQDILLNYAETGITEISNYSIPNNAVILSDLDSEGVLFAFRERPDNLFRDYEIEHNTVSLIDKMNQNL